LNRSGVGNTAFGEFDVKGYIVDSFTFRQFDGIAFAIGLGFLEFEFYVIEIDR
jgi:hypothetical protein